MNTPFQRGQNDKVKFVDLSNGKLPSPIAIHDYFVIKVGGPFEDVILRPGDTLLAIKTTEKETVLDDFLINRAGSTMANSHAELPDLDESGHPADVITLDTTNFNGILSVVDSDVQTALETLDDINEGHNYTNDRFVATAGQILFTLSAAPSDNNLIEFFINGVKYYNGYDYSIVGQNITWSEVDFVIEDGMVVNVKYTI